MKKKIEVNINSIPHNNYIYLKNNEYKISNQTHHYGNLEFKFDDSKIKKVKYESIIDIINRLSISSNLRPEDINNITCSGVESRIQDYFINNISNYISKKIGNSIVDRFSRFFYYKGKFKYYHEYVDTILKEETFIKGSISTNLNLESSSYLSLDFENKNIKFLINLNKLKEEVDKLIESHLKNKERYIKESWSWSERKIDDIKKVYEDTLSDYKNLLNISNLYDIKLNFILNGIKECVFNCEFEEISDFDLISQKNSKSQKFIKQQNIKYREIKSHPEKKILRGVDWSFYHESQKQAKHCLLCGCDNYNSCNKKNE